MDNAVVRNSLLEMEKDLFEIKRFWEGVIGSDSYYLNYLNDEIVVGILADKNIIDAVSKYYGRVAQKVAESLARVAYHLRDKDAVVEIARTVSKYDGGAAREVAYSLARVTHDWGDKDAVVEIADILASEEVVNYVKKYDGDAAREVIYRLAHVAYDLRDEKKVIKIVKMLENVDKVIFEMLENEEIYEIIDENLDRLVSNKSSFDAVAAYIKSKKRLPKPDESNIKDYNTLALEYVKSKYGLNKDISIHQILMLFSAPESSMEEVIDLVNKSEEKNVKYYSLETKDGNSLNYSKDDLMKYSIISIVGSRDKDLEKKAIDAIASIVGQKSVNRARSEFNSNYKHLMKYIVAAFRDRDYSKALDILKQTKNEAIMDVINAVDYKDVDIGSARFIKAVESKNPLDYDSRVQMACVYLPSGARSEEILEYCRNDNFVLVRYDVGNQTLGSAICYMEDGIFLVDSVEGHRRFRKPEIFEIVYNDLISRAREKKAKMIVFNINVYNEAPRKFIEYLSRKNLPKERIKMRLDTDGYLEAKKDGVKGYVVKV